MEDERGEGIGEHSERSARKKNRDLVRSDPICSRRGAITVRMERDGKIIFNFQQDCSLKGFKRRL
jgi:hypothetical protein